ncbi:MAG: 16S rRNA (uracil(1498)-N(3))-methyltransferase [Phycisphaerae bacterium]|nr:16S rRNA (uracil(1498)-N(3))-methyltransferase [Phycisphaerae bacterium]
MRTIRLYCDNLQTDTVVLDETEGHHLCKVLRLGPGNGVELFDGDGTCAEGTIETADRRGIRVRIAGRRYQPQRIDHRIVLAVSMPKGQRFEQVIEQATELGVDRIVPVVFERTVKQASGPSALERYRKIMISACKQCGRNRLPQMDLPLGLEECLERIRHDFPHPAMLFGGFSSRVIPLCDWPMSDSDTAFFIGPEGGLNEAETKTLRDAGAIEVRLCDTVLRIETAAAACSAILCAKRDSRC